MECLLSQGHETFVLAGDQADQKLLDQILADSKAFGGYDVIIDDGGHTVNQMLTSIKVGHLPSTLSVAGH